MLSVQVDATRGIAVLEPSGALSKEDFERAAQAIDPHLEKSGKLNGLVVRVQSFPGWDSFGALASHLRFLKAHHRRIARIALCTDSALGNVGEAEAEKARFLAAKARVPDSRRVHNNTVVDLLGVAEAMLNGELEYRKGNHDAAFAHLRKAVELDDALPYD